MSVSITTKVTLPPLFDPDRQFSPLCLNSTSIASVTTSVTPSIGSRSPQTSTPSPSPSAYHYQAAFFASEDNADSSRPASAFSITSAKTQQMPSAPPQPNHRKQPNVGSNNAVNPPPQKPSSGRRSARPPSAAGDDSSRNSANEQQVPEQPMSKQRSVAQQPTSSPQLGGKQRNNRRVKSSDPLTTINSVQHQTQQSPQQHWKKAYSKNGKSEQQSPNGDNSKAHNNHSNSDSEKNERNGNSRKKGQRNPPSPPESILTNAQTSMVMQQPLSNEPRAPARRRLSAPDIAAFRAEEYARPGVNQELYAGATFQNSPVASALPLPVFSTRGPISRPVDHPISALSSSLNAAPPAADVNNFNAQAEQQFQQFSPFIVMTSKPQMPFGAVPINGFVRHNGDAMRLSHSYTAPTAVSNSSLSSSAQKFSDETAPTHHDHHQQQQTYPPMHHPFMHMANLHNNFADNAAPSRSPSIRRVALNDMSNSEQGLFSMDDEAEAAEERRKKSRDLMSLLAGVSVGGEANRNSFPSTASQPMSVLTSAQGKLGSSLPTTPPVDLLQISRDLKYMLRIRG
ncbi:hypothetical protein BJ742DRAFT_780379 [Cladochytrium replicatum]|nr:hypothetical protein BJ742DRAFT_780379 [Cladochytrium replicatum]